MTQEPASRNGAEKSQRPRLVRFALCGRKLKPRSREDKAKSIRKWLEEDAGTKLGLTSLTSYISRLRRRQSAAAISARQGEASSSIAVRTGEPAKEPMRDPMAPAMQALAKRRLDIRELHGDGDPQDQNLI